MASLLLVRLRREYVLAGEEVLYAERGALSLERESEPKDSEATPDTLWVAQVALPGTIERLVTYAAVSSASGHLKEESSPESGYTVSSSS